VHAALDHDRIAFDPFYSLERSHLTTRTAWSTTALRVGIGYRIVRDPEPTLLVR
jgi:hypothetical protein